MAKVRTFEVLSPLKSLEIKSVSVDDPALLDFENANPLEEGEWLVLNTDGEAVRPTVSPSIAEAGPYALFAEKGRSDTQMARKVPLIMGGSFLFRTKIFTTNALLVPGAAVEVATVVYDGLNRAGLQLFTAGKAVGHVIRAEDADGWLTVQYTAS
jgi:hypothetical protein